MSLRRSFSFRLVLSYVLLVSLSLLILLSTFYWLSVHVPLSAVRKDLTAESDRLSTVHAQQGETALAAALESRARAGGSRAPFHLVADMEGRTLSTNLPSWPSYSGQRWHRIEADTYRAGDEDDYEALALDRTLSDGTRLLVGRDVEDLQDLHEAIFDAASYLTGATFLVALLGGILMNRAIGRRIGSIGDAARRVMGGDLGQRVPLQGSGDDFDRLSETLNLMLDRIESGNEAVRRVSDNVAHELRTPLARLQGLLAELQQAEGGATSDLIGKAASEADRLRRMFDAVLRVARIEGGRHATASETIDLSELLADAAELYAPAAQEKGVELRAEYPPELTVRGDRDLLFQALSNLLDNAIKFTPAKGRILLTAFRDGDNPRIRIADSGPGVRPELVSRLGERFFRGDAPADLPGFGLGLALVEAAARLHGSRLQFANDAGLRVEWCFGANS